MLRLLRSQKTGVLCAIASALLLGAGTLIMDRAPEAYAGLHWDDVRFFFTPVRAIHAWFYALALALAVFAASTLVCTWDTLRTRIRARTTRLGAYGAPLVHLAFVAALVAHLWGGLTSESRQHLVGAAGTPIAGAVYRLTDVDQDAYPNGMPRRLEATLSRIDGDGRTTAVRVGSNAPIVLDFGATALLLADVTAEPEAVLRVGGRHVVLRGGQTAGTGPGAVTLHRVIVRPDLKMPFADVSTGGRRQLLALATPTSPDATAFVDVRAAPAIVLSERYNPSVPLVVTVALIVALGVVLVGVEHLWRRRRLADRDA